MSGGRPSEAFGESETCWCFSLARALSLWLCRQASKLNLSPLDTDKIPKERGFKFTYIAPTREGVTSIRGSFVSFVYL